MPCLEAFVALALYRFHSVGLTHPAIFHYLLVGPSVHRQVAMIPIDVIGSQRQIKVAEIDLSIPAASYDNAVPSVFRHQLLPSMREPMRKLDADAVAFVSRLACGQDLQEFPLRRDADALQQ